MYYVSSVGRKNYVLFKGFLSGLRIKLSWDRLTGEEQI